MSKAIVLVAFGSANLDGIKQSIGLLEQDLNEYFAGEYTVLKAFTSNKIIELLKERHDYVIPHLSKALFNLVNQGYEEVIIQPLHIMSTSDIKRIEEVVDEYKYSMKRIVICNTLFSDEEEVVETKEIEVEEKEEHKLPTFMRNKIEEEEKREEVKKTRTGVSDEIISDREIVKTRTNNNFAFPIEMDEPDTFEVPKYSNQNI